MISTTRRRLARGIGAGLTAAAALGTLGVTAAAAARPAPIPRARRRLVVLIMMSVLPETLRPVPGGMASGDLYAGRRPGIPM